MTIFYKYCNAKVGFENILTNATLKWTNPQEFNDPFGCQCPLLFETVEKNKVLSLPVGMGKNNIILNDVSIDFCNRQMDSMRSSLAFRRMEEALIGTVRSSGILCLTKDSQNILMWSHYADNHKGICLGFSPEGLNNSIFKLAKPVLYTYKYPKLYIDDIMRDISDKQFDYTEKLINMYTLTKFKDWAYEKEWRIFEPIYSEKERIKKFDAKELRQVILGAKIESSDATAIRKLVKEKYPHVKIFQANIVQGSFELGVTELTS